MLFVGLIEGCTVSTATPYWTPSTLVRYQKPDQIGTTDLEQRGKDSMACGALDPTTQVTGIATPKPGESIVGFSKDGRFQKWRQCMLDKGYIAISCGTDSETTLCK